MSNESDSRKGQQTKTDLGVAGTSFAGTQTGPYTTAITGVTRTQQNSPDAYRLAKKPDGTIVLQGAYLWREGLSKYGHEWREIPTVDLDTAV